MGELTVTFPFVPGEKVQTPWGDIGIITSVAVNEDLGQRFFVKRDRDSVWFMAADLKHVEDTTTEV